MARVADVDTDDVEEQDRPRIVGGGSDLPFSFDDFDFDLEEFAMDDATVEGRGGAKMHPWVGMSVWLAPFQAPLSLVEGGAATRGDAASQARAMPMLRDGLSLCIAGHNLIDPRTGEYFPQFWRNPDALLGLPAETIYDLLSLVMNGELSETRKKGSLNGRGGTTTRRSTGRKTGR